MHHSTKTRTDPGSGLQQTRYGTPTKRPDHARQAAKKEIAGKDKGDFVNDPHERTGATTKRYE
jgi:hypothetical protein